MEMSCVRLIKQQKAMEMSCVRLIKEQIAAAADRSLAGKSQSREKTKQRRHLTEDQENGNELNSKAISQWQSAISP